MRASIAIINKSKLLTDNEIVAALPALQKQIDGDFEPVWNIGAKLSFNPTPPDPGAWQLQILDSAPKPTTDLGNHGPNVPEIDPTLPNGLPVGRVFMDNTNASIKAGFQKSWTSTVSRELLEMLANPDGELFIRVAINEQVRFYCREVCDPCADDTDGYDIDTVRVSNFVFPSWFRNFAVDPTPTQFDHQKLIQKPLMIRPGATAIISGDVTIFEDSNSQLE